MTVFRHATRKILAELIVEAVRPFVGGVGIIVRDVLYPDPMTLFQRFHKLSSEEDFPVPRITYLLEDGSDAAEMVGIDKDMFSTEIEQAERWRNDANLKEPIIVIARGDEAKLSSLEDFATIRSQDLKRELVLRAMDGPAGTNEPQMFLWEILSKDHAVGLGQIVDYYLSLESIESEDLDTLSTAESHRGDELPEAEQRLATFKVASTRELHRVGLLPDPALFHNADRSKMKDRLESNREMVERLQILTPRDRKAIKKAIEDSNVQEQEELRAAFHQLQLARSTGAGFRSITYEEAQRLFKLRTKDPRPAIRSVDVAAESLINPALIEDQDRVFKSLQEILNSDQKFSGRTRKIRTPLSHFSGDAISTIRLDVLRLVAKLLDRDVYGGLIEVDLDNIDDILRRFNHDEHIVDKWERKWLQEILSNIAEITEEGRIIAELFDVYDAARCEILPYLRTLSAEPLVIAADSEARMALIGVVEAYENLILGLQEHYEKMLDVVDSDINDLVGVLLLTDVVVIQGNQRLFAVLSPMHPLFLWYYVKYANVVEAQRDKLDERDRLLVADTVDRLPNFLTSLFVPAVKLDHGRSGTLTFAGRLGQLPYYSDVVQRSDSEDGVKAISKLIADYVALEPHARHGVRVALIDPPDAGQYLRNMATFRDQRVLDGAHVAVYRHQPALLSVELRLDASDEESVAQTFRAINVDRRFTFEVLDRPDEFGPREDEPFHLVVVFDQSNGRPSRAKPTAHSILPLAVPRAISYSPLHKTIELKPTPSDLFGSYFKLVERLSSGPSTYSIIHQQQELRDALQGLARYVPWIIVADRHVDRDLIVGKLRISTATEGERDVAAFTKCVSAFRRPLREVARHYNTFITDEELDGLLEQLSNLLDSGLLNLRPDNTGKLNSNRIKGLLATLIAARWYHAEAGPERRLLISLDGQEARRWMHLRDDPLRADLVGFEWTNNDCTITVIEVKAVESPEHEYKIKKGKVTGTAVDQMLSTRKLLVEILTMEREDELITTPARREILREQLYRELTKSTYSQHDRELWADRLQRLLDGDVNTTVCCHLIDVRLGHDVSTVESQFPMASDGEEMVATHVTRLNEEVIDLRHIPKVFPREENGGSKARKNTPGDLDESKLNGGEIPKSIDKLTTSPEEATPTVNRPRALLGKAPGTYGKPFEVWFDPNLPGEKLPNPHISITGETGSGKTEATKTIVSALRNHDIPTLILDFKDDYYKESFRDSEGFQLYDAGFGGLPLNPLVPALDKQQDLIAPTQHLYQVASIVKRIYKLGDQQEIRLREAIRRAYQSSGISLSPGLLSVVESFPAFEAVRNELLGAKENETLLGRLSPIFDLGIFADEATQSNLDEFFHSSAVIRLGLLPSDEVKNSVAEFFLMALYNHLIRRPQTHELGRLLIVDEAWRVVESPFLTPLMREGRAFGLGVVIASQFPTDLPKDIRGSTATRLFFSQSQVEQIREIQRTIVGKTSGPEADHVASVVRGLSPLSCVIHSTQFNPFVRVAINPYFLRHVDDDVT